ncbi:MAG: PepSY-associated TM helix domain-containing protein, partial [Pseudomonadota bacterium]
SGTVLGLLLYVVIVTGAVAVFAKEIGIWSQPGAYNSTGIGSKVDSVFRQNARSVDPKFYEEVVIFRNREDNLVLSFRAHEINPKTNNLEDNAVELTIDPDTTQILNRWEGFFSDKPSEPGYVLKQFWVDLHVELYLPRPYGLILVGILGLMMMAAAISGILIHRHLIREMFLPARTSKRVLSARDYHNLAGTWGIPFAILLAFTGVFFSFVRDIGIPVLAMVAFGGDQAAMIETIIGGTESLSKAQAPLASLDYILQDASKRVDGVINSILIQHYDTASANVRINMAAADGQLVATVLGYEGVTRQFMGFKPAFGQVPSVGSSLISIIGPLHFGNFAGFASKIVWLGLGLAMAFVTATGMLLWTKRREEQRLWREFHKWIYVFIWGLPIAMLVSAYAFFLTLPAGDPAWWTPASFFLASAIIIVGCIRGSLPEESFRQMTGYMCLGLPILRHLTGGTSWSEALTSQGQGAVIAIDLILLFSGLVLVFWHRIRDTESRLSAKPEPAE